MGKFDKEDEDACYCYFVEGESREWNMRRLIECAKNASK